MGVECAAAVVASVPLRITIEFIADLVCPWCFIGWERLQKAAVQAKQQNIAIEIKWTPFILRRQLPKEGVDKLQMFAEQLGEGAAAAKLDDIKRTAAEADGLILNFKGQRAGNSEDAHRLLLWTEVHHPALWPGLAKTLFTYYNQQKMWIGDLNVLLAAAQEAGLPVTDIKLLLADGSVHSAELEEGLRRSTVLGTSAVPLYIISDDVRLPGALPVSELLSHIDSEARSPRSLCRWYVDRANAHDLDGLAEMLSPNVDMFGGPCDRAGLSDFFSLYPEIHWEVRTAYEYSEVDGNTVGFAYTRTWRDRQTDSCLAVNAAEQISFNHQGQVVKIAYTVPPSGPLPCS